MCRTHRLSISALVLVVSGPLAWLACGGESKPAESPGSESTPSASSEGSTASKKAAPAESASSAPETETASAPAASSAPAAAPAPPPTPSLGSTDCGRCIDKTCTKQGKACGKDGDCQSMMDGMHSCSSGAASCVDGAMMPSAAKPKKLAAAYEACVKKAIAAKACKAKCQ
jgi:hypothetical protein